MNSILFISSTLFTFLCLLKHSFVIYVYIVKKIFKMGRTEKQINMKKTLFCHVYVLNIKDARCIIVDKLYRYIIAILMEQTFFQENKDRNLLAWPKNVLGKKIR